MKKLVSGVIISALVITAGTASAFAYHGRYNQTYKLNQNYVDLNNDGICDNNNVTGGNGLNFVDANGDGICDNNGACGNGLNFVDVDGDGICDYHGTYGNGLNFVDDNGDGVCDNYGTFQKNGTGMHRGGHCN